MHRAVLANLAEANIVIMAAAVADYCPVSPYPAKIKRGTGGLTVEFEATPDILADVSRVKGERILVGFAAETDHVAEHARQKLAAKAADLIVANDVTVEGAGFDQDTNIVTLYARDGAEIAVPRMSKLDVAQRVLDQVVALQRAPHRIAAAPPHVS
jgi:phosphopantothenoylcysteine decarboxylase/phosphopantothenate--cysteine ligase